MKKNAIPLGLAFLLILCLSIPIPASGASLQQSPVPLARIPISISGGYVLFKVKIDGSRELDFLFDTGATRTGIDPDIASSLGLVTTEQTRNDGQGPFTERLAEAVELTVGSLTLPALDMLQRPHDRMELSLGVNIDGVIGADLLRDYVIEIDYDSRRFTIFDSESFEYEGTGTALDITANRYFATVDAEMAVADGEVLTGRFLIDTGAGLTLALNTPFVDENDLLDRIGAMHLAYTLAAQDVEMTSYPARVSRFQLGLHEFEHMPVLLSQTTAGPLSPTVIAGIVGNRIWRRFNTVFDYSRQKIYLTPNRSFEDGFQVDCSGLSVSVPSEGNVVVSRVLPQSPAGEVGILVGDEITTIADREIAEYTLSEVRRLLARDMATVRLAIRRDGKLLQYSLQLRRIF